VVRGRRRRRATAAHRGLHAAGPGPRGSALMQARIATFAVPGQFNSIRYESAQDSGPAPDEVEIEVAAAALNFKDVLLALGIIPTAPGAAPAFGFECAGRVRRIGAAVTALLPGDEVVAIGSGCLATAV